MILRAAALTLALTGGGAAAQDGAVVDCAEAAAMQDCALFAGPLILVFLYQPVSDGAVLTLTQSTAEGGAREVGVPIPVKGAMTAPSLYDINGDGLDELFVPVAHGAGLTSFQLWAVAEAGFFAPLDTLSAVAPEDFVPEGDLIRQTRAQGDGSTLERAYFLDDAGLTLAYAVQSDARSGRCTMISDTTEWNEAIILADCEARLGEVEVEDSQ